MIAVATSLWRQSVYNLEVHGEHVYEVADSGVLVHNSNPECDIHRIGGSSVENLRLKPAEKELSPPGISVLKADSAEEAAAQMRKAFPKATELHKLTKTVGTSSVEAIRRAGFDVIPDPTRKFPNHHRITHPDGIKGFIDENLKNLSGAFKDTSGH